MMTVCSIHSIYLIFLVLRFCLSRAPGKQSPEFIPNTIQVVDSKGNIVCQQFNNNGGCPAGVKLDCKLPDGDFCIHINVHKNVLYERIEGPLLCITCKDGKTLHAPF